MITKIKTDGNDVMISTNENDVMISKDENDVLSQPMMHNIDQ